MNKVYRTVYNHALDTWVAVSELVAAKGKKSGSRCAAGVGIASGDPAWRTSHADGFLLKVLVAALVLVLPLTGHASNIYGSGCSDTTPSQTFTGADTTTRTAVQTDGSGYYSTVAGCGANGSGKNAVTLFGSGSQVTGNYGTALGFMGSAGIQATAVGVQASASDYSIAIGALSKSSAAGAIAIGGYPAAGIANAVGAQATAQDAIAVGSASSVVAGATSGIAIGRGAIVNGAFGIAQGDGTTSGATGQNVAIGSSGTIANSSTAAGGAVAIGRGQKATGNGAVAIGDPNVSNGTGAVTMGADNTAAGNLAGTIAANGAVAIGNANSAIGQGSVALGNASKASAAGAVALGDTAVANNANDVAIGSKSTTAAPHTGTTAQFGGTAAGVQAAASTNGVVSVGAAGTERQIQNVAAGVISATSTDAINGSQLNSVVTGVNNLGTTTASTLGGGATYSPATGNITGFSSPINSISATGAVTGPTAQTTVAAALTALNTNVDNTANIAVKYDVNGGTKITLGATGGAGAGAPVTITNMAPATLNATSTDAVNGSQLFATNTTVNNINNGAGIKYFHANSTLADSTATGTDSVAVGPTASSTATNAVALGNGATAGTANSVALGSGASATGTTLGTAAYGVGGTATTGGEVNVANGANGRRITGLAAGSSATDAVNVSQLNKVGQDTATALGGGAALNATTGIWTAPSYSTNSINAAGTNTGPLVSTNVGAALTNLNTSVTNTAAVAVKYDDASTKNQVTFNPAGTSVKLTNVAAGALNASSTDAVNGSQLFATNQTVDNIVNNGAGIKYFHSNSTLADSSATGQDSVAIGPLASATIANGVALGANSSATGTTLANAAYGVGGAATAGGEVNIANGANGRRITGLAAGSSATDAVNVSQLNKAGQDTATALGGGAALDANTGVWTAPSYSTNSISVTGANTGPLVSNNVGAALSNLNTSLTNTAAVAVKYDDASTKTQVTFNPAGTAVKLTNVAVGALNSTSTDAVNGSQLFATNQTVDNIVNNGAGIKYFHSNSTLADSSATGQDSVAIGPLASATVANGVALGSNSSATGATLANAAYGVGGAATGVKSISPTAPMVVASRVSPPAPARRMRSTSAN
ncbi:hypothetical protein M5C90_22270 [Pseudomonas chlororaphis subsp. piscium]|nr:hypothetical protein M5C90_22270 [Pseudomonas chlororaphis subsp. piscium]